MKKAAVMLLILLGALGMGAVPGVAATPSSHLAYLAGVHVGSSGNELSLDLRIKGEPDYRLEYLDKGVQLTLEDAFIDPAKRVFNVTNPAIQEIFAYQYNRNTVRLRIMTKDVDGRALEGRVTLEPTTTGFRVAIALPDAAPSSGSVRGGAVADVENAVSIAASAPAPAAGPSPAAEAGAPKAIPTAPKYQPAPLVAAKADAMTSGPPADVASAAGTAQKGADEPTIADDFAALLAKPTKPEAATPERARKARTQALEQLSRIVSGAAAKDPVVHTEDGHMIVAAAHVPAAPADAGLPQGGGSPADSAAEARTHSAALKNSLTPVPATTDITVPGMAATGESGAAPQGAGIHLLPVGSGRGSGTLWSDGIRMAGGLLVVLGLMLGIAAVLRRFRKSGFAPRYPIRVLSSAAVGSRQNIMVVEVDARRMVVGVGPGGMQLLAHLDAHDLAATGPDGAENALLPQPTQVTPFSRLLGMAGRTFGSGTVTQTTERLKHRLNALRADK